MGDNKGDWQVHKRALRKQLAAAIERAIKAQKGEHSWELVADKIAKDHDDPKMMKALWYDAVRQIVHQEYRQRSQIQIKAQLSLWSKSDLDEGMILLGEGQAVTYNAATIHHWEQKVANQTQVIDSTTARRDETIELIRQLRPEMGKWPEMTTGDWMREHGYCGGSECNDDPPSPQPPAQL